MNSKQTTSPLSDKRFIEVGKLNTGQKFKIDSVIYDMIEHVENYTRGKGIDNNITIPKNTIVEWIIN